MFDAKKTVDQHQTDTVWSEILAMSVRHNRGNLHDTAAFSDWIFGAGGGFTCRQPW